MIVVDDVAFSLDCWNWYNQRTAHAKEAFEGEFPIDAFRFLLPKEHQKGRLVIEIYQQLNAGQFWELVNEVFMLMSDIHKEKRLPITTGVGDLNTELLKVEKMVVYWVLREDHDPSNFGKLNKDFITPDNTLNNRFALDAYLICQCNTWNVDRLSTTLGGRVTKNFPRQETNASGMILFNATTTNEFSSNDDKFDEFIKNIVRISVGGDMDEFIINVKMQIAQNAIGPFHQELAHARGFTLMGVTDFTSIPSHESWRRLFTNYFDGEEDNFDTFFATYTYDCLRFLFRDFLAVDDLGGLAYLPVYKIFSKNQFKKSFDMEIRKLINTQLIRDKIFKIYKRKI